MNAQQVFSCDWSAGGMPHGRVGNEVHRRFPATIRQTPMRHHAPASTTCKTTSTRMTCGCPQAPLAPTAPPAAAMPCSTRRGIAALRWWWRKCPQQPTSRPNRRTLTSPREKSFWKTTAGGASDADYSITTRMIVVNNTCASIFPMSSVEVATSWGTTASDNTTATNFSAANNDTLSFSEGSTTQRSVAAALPVCSFLMAGGVLLFLLLI